MWQNSLTPPPPQGGMDAKSLDAQNGVGPPPPPTVVWTFGQKKFVSRISINKLIACLERVQWRYQNRERRGRGGQLLFYVLKQVECRQKLLREPQYKLFFYKNYFGRVPLTPPLNTCPNFSSLKSLPELLTPPPFCHMSKISQFFF